MSFELRVVSEMHISTHPNIDTEMRLLTKLMNKEEIDEKTVKLPYTIDAKGTTK